MRDLWRLIRPRQWVKNGFVLMGALFANALRQPAIVNHVLLAAAAFCLVSSGVYIFNDILDRASDANHPVKRNRPLAANRVSIGTAVVLLAAIWTGGFVVGFLASKKVLVILLVYVVLNVAYSLQLKHVVILDVFIIASGFMLRILAGTVGVGIAPSQWLLLCGLMIALFLGFAKRRAELYALNSDGPTHRKVLDLYQPVLLDKMIVITGTCVILTYSLYTLSPVTVSFHHTESLVYTVPFVMYGIFRYIYTLHRQSTGGDPATEIFRDPHLLLAILGWLVSTIWIIARA